MKECCTESFKDEMEDNEENIEPLSSLNIKDSEGYMANNYIIDNNESLKTTNEIVNDYLGKTPDEKRLIFEKIRNNMRESEPNNSNLILEKWASSIENQVNTFVNSIKTNPVLNEVISNELAHDNQDEILLLGEDVLAKFDS